jgi:hypothetical protein
VATSLYTKNAKTVFFIVVRHALDEVGQHFLGRGFRLRFHTERRIMDVTPKRVFVPRNEKTTDPDA